MRIDLTRTLKNRPLLKHAQAVAWALMIQMAISPAYAQVSAVTSNVNAKLNGFLQVVMGVGLALFTIALVLAGYKFAMVEGTKWHDLKGIVIGGTIFGAAGAIAAYLVN